MFTKILVPLDRSQVAEKAIAPALDLARRYKGTLFLLCTCTTELSREYLQDFSNDHNWFWSISSKDPVYLEGMDYLNKLIQALSEPNIEIQSLFVKGDEAGAIIGISEAQDINLIVMTKHCRAETSLNQLGDITERVLHHASCPVMVICSSLADAANNSPLDNLDKTANRGDPIKA
jgi:nucleotide-binding universal stress UspA family protein